MTTLPTYTAEVPVPVDQGPRASGFGEVGAAVAGVGQQVEQAGAATTYLAVRRARELATMESNDYVSTNAADLTDTQYKRFLDARDNAPPGAKGFTDQFMQGYDADLKARIDAAPNDIARRQMSQHGMALRSTIHNNALMFERDAGIENRKENIAGNVSKLSNIAISSPELYPDLKAQVDNAVDAQKGDMTAGEYAAAKVGAQRTLATSAISGLVDKDPNAALKALGSGQFDELIHPEDKLRLTSSADAEIKRREVEARAEARANAAEARQAAEENRFNLRLGYQDELAAAADGKTIDPDFDKKLAAGGFKPEQAQAMLNSLNDTREVASISQGLSTMTPDQIAAAVAGHVPAGFGYAEEAKNQGHLEKAAADVLARRQKDPAAEATRAYPDIAQGLASGDPAQTSAAIRKSLQVQRETFGLGDDQVRPLTKPAAAEIVQRFKTAGSDDKRLGVLASVTNLRNDDGSPDHVAGRAVLSQLDAAGLPAGADRALEALDRGDQGAAREIIGVAALKPGEFPKLTQPEGTSVAEQVKGLRDSNDTGTGLDARVAAITGASDRTKQMSSGEDIVHRLTAVQVAAGADPATAAARADKIVHGDGPVVNKPGLAAVRLPSGADASAAAAGLEATRDGLDLNYLAPTREQIGAAAPKGTAAGEIEGVYNLQKRKFDQWADAVKQHSEFVNVGPDSFVLISQVPGGPVGSYSNALPGPDGRPRIFKLDEVLKAAAAPDVSGGANVRAGPFGGSGSDTLQADQLSTPQSKMPPGGTGPMPKVVHQMQADELFKGAKAPTLPTRVLSSL